MMTGKLSFIAFLCALISTAVDFAQGFVATNSRVPSIAASSGSSGLPTSLAAKGGGKKKKSKRGAQTTKGFGAPPPKLDEILSAFKTRVTDDAGGRSCPCGSGETYGDCCGPLHGGDRLCLTMTDVLRSRYSAFSLRNIKYVMDTTHEECRDHREDKVAWAKDLNKGGMFDSFEFVKLEAGEEEMSDDNDNEGFVDFSLTLRVKEGNSDNAVAGQETGISERSRFLRDPKDGSWRYASGDVRSDVAGLEETTLNA